MRKTLAIAFLLCALQSFDGSAQDLSVSTAARPDADTGRSAESGRTGMHAVNHADGAVADRLDTGCVSADGDELPGRVALPLETMTGNARGRYGMSFHSLRTSWLAPLDSMAVEEGPDARRLWLVGGVMAAGNAAIMAYYFQTFYKNNADQRTKWHTFNDWYNADLNVDKLGHIWGTQVFAHTLFHLFRWTRLPERESMIWSSSLAFFFQLQMEVIDGLYAKWGFSWWDIAANAIGSVWPNLQRIYPALQGVNLKMSYHPSDNVKNGWVEHEYLRDYDGFTYWLSVAPERYLPAGLKAWWPDWLAIAVGYGANNTMLGKDVYNSANGVGQGEQEWYLALDYDLRQLPGDSPFMHFVKESLNLFHFPSPAVRITPSGIWYGLYW